MTPPALPHAILARPAAPEEETVFDPEKLIAAVGGKPETRAAVVSMVRNMLETGMRPLTEASQALQENRPHDAGRLLHTLRGSLGTLGAKRLVVVCQALEQAIKYPGGGDDLPALLAAAERELATLLETARLWVASEEAGAAEKKSSGLDAVVLNDLLTCLRDRNMRACELYDQLRPSLLLWVDMPGFVAMEQAMATLQFEPVLQQLQALAQVPAQAQDLAQMQDLAQTQNLAQTQVSAQFPLDTPRTPT